MLLFLVSSGFIIGILSGMLGIGGGIIIAPILLYVPGWIGLPVMSMKTISGLTMVQGLVGAASGYLVHRRYRVINPTLIYLLGPVMIIATFSGAHFSGGVDDTILKAVFALMAVAAAVLMQVKKDELPMTAPVEEINFNRPLAVLIAALIGFLGGLVGQGGSFVLVPALINILNIPTKVAMGSNLGIVLLASLAGLGGKASAGLIEPLSALALMVGVIPGALLGGYLSHRMKSIIIKKIFSILIVLV
ncbi:MAG: sulfite exporter TauE/SafE family protein, partial [Bacillota bacterium]|nr:sulfite exporter TauE/SafE family protein [Bacillota bacterium]